MLNKATTDQIAGMLGLQAEDFAQALSSEKEEELTLKEGRFLTGDEVEEIKDNHGKTRYDAGAEASREMLLKNMSKDVGFEENIKDPSKFITAFKEQILNEANIEPDKKISELESSLEKLRGVVQTKDEDYLKLQTEVEGRKVKFDVQSFIPDMPSGLGISKEEATSLFFMNREIKDGNVLKNGEIVKNGMEKPISVENAVKDFVTEKGWNAVPTGRGGGSGSNGSTRSTMQDYKDTLKERGLREGSMEANALLSEIAKEHPEILD